MLCMPSEIEKNPISNCMISIMLFDYYDDLERTITPKSLHINAEISKAKIVNNSKSYITTAHYCKRCALLSAKRVDPEISSNPDNQD